MEDKGAPGPPPILKKIDQTLLFDENIINHIEDIYDALSQDQKSQALEVIYDIHNYIKKVNPLYKKTAILRLKMIYLCTSNKFNF